MTRRVSSLFLAALLFMAAALSCGDSGSAAPASTTASQGEAAPVTEPEETSPPDYLMHDCVTETDLGGYTYNELGRFTSDITSFYENGLYAEELNGDAINDIVYQRNHDIMERFNCVIEFTNRNDADLSSLFKKTVKAGDDAYQLVVYSQQTFGSWGLDGMLIDWKTVDSIQLDQP